MTHTHKHVRTGLAAIAAVLALSSTPIFAQDAGTVTEPVADTTSQAPAPDPLAPEPATEPAATEPSQAPTAEPAATAKRAASRTAPKTRTAQTTRTAKPAASSAPASAPVPAANPAPSAELAPEPIPVPVAEPTETPALQPAPVDNGLLTEENLPIAGAAALGLLALAGTGLAVRRNRRRREEEEWQDRKLALNQAHQSNHRPNDNEPAFARSSQGAVAPAAAVRTDVPRTKLPEDFDLSRFGPHVRAAYLGPTPDNPSLSLKYRLRRAAAMDQRARLEGREAPVQPAVMPAQPSRQPMPQWNANRSSFMLRRADQDIARRPAFQK